MNGRERVRILLQGGTPDRVPITLHNFQMATERSGRPYDVVLRSGELLAEAMFAEWNEQELAVADAVSVDVARRVLDQAFWPPKEPAPRMYPEFAAICQDGVFRSSTAAEDEAPVE